MPVSPPRHRPHVPNSARHRAPEADRQARRTYATNSAIWRAIRAAQLSDEPLCRICSKRGKTTAATQVDHIDGDAKNDAPNNYQSLCAKCHARKTAIEDGSFGRVQALPRWLGKPLIPVIVVCGPPGSGKSTHVADEADEHDLVLDLDVMAAEMFDRPIYDRREGEWQMAMRERNRQLAGLSSPQSRYRRCWLIVSAGSPRHRMFWKAYADELIVIDPGKTECVARVMADERRPQAARAQQLQVIADWC